MTLFCKPSWLWNFIVLICFLAFSSACTTREPLSQAAQIFRDHTLKNFDRLTPRLLQAFDTDTLVRTAGPVIKSFLLDSHRNGCQMSGVGVLDEAGSFITGYKFDDNGSSVLRDQFGDIKFGSFVSVKKVLESDEIVQATLYFKNEKILVVGSPILKKGNVVAIAYFYFQAPTLEKKCGITEEEFLQIDFNVR